MKRRPPLRVEYDEPFLPIGQIMAKAPERGVPSRQAGDRFCTQCKSLCASAGGMQLVTADGLHQRWICKRCNDKRVEAQPKPEHD